MVFSPQPVRSRLDHFNVERMKYMPFMKYDSNNEPQFDIPFNAENWANSYISDRFDKLNASFITTITPNGYELGVFVLPQSGEVMSLGGADAALFTINSSTGMVTLTNADAVTTVNATLIVDVIGSIQGTFAGIKIKVLPSDGKFIFVDAVNGSDSNTGFSPEIPRQTVATPAWFSNNQMRGILFKRGSGVYPDVDINFSTRFTYGSYGNPQADMPTLLGGTTITNHVFETRTDAGTNASEVYISDLIIDGNNLLARPFRITNITPGGGIYAGLLAEISIKNCIIRNNGAGNPAGNIDPQGIYAVGLGGKLILRHNKFENITGDGLYGINLSKSEIAFNDFDSPKGGEADCVQFPEDNGTL